MKCGVCGFYFPLRKKNKYIATDKCGMAAALNGGAVKYECFDCPVCGCQNIIQPIKDRVITQEDENNGKTDT